MKTATLMIAMLSLTSAAFASDRNYVAPKGVAGVHAAAQSGSQSVQADTSRSEDGRVHFVHNGK